MRCNRFYSLYHRTFAPTSSLHASSGALTTMLTARRLNSGAPNAAATEPPGGQQQQQSSSSSSNSSGKSRPRSSSELLGLVAGCSMFPISVLWMTKDDASTAAASSPEPKVPIGADGPAFGKMAVTTVPKPQLGGPFRLVSSKTGATVTDTDVFSGKWTLLYFGFAKCAEICPNTLKFISELMAESDVRYGRSSDAATVAEANKLQAVFLSIDFVRDTPASVEAFLAPFDSPKKRIIGLTGTRQQVEEAARNWRVYFSSYDESEEERLAREAKGVPEPQLDDTYQFDHSSAIYLVGPDGKMKDFYFREIGVPNTAGRLGLHFQDAYGINGN